MLSLDGKFYPLNPYTREVYDAWRAYAITLAKQEDQPLARFIARHLKGIEGQDRHYAIAGWLANPDWDAPPDSLIQKQMRSLAGVRHLLDDLVDNFDPALVTEENRLDLLRQIQAASNPTDDDIKKSNQAIREGIEAAHAKARE
jgi:hypothetical protein